MPLIAALIGFGLLYIAINELLKRITGWRSTPTADSQDHRWGSRAQWEYRTNTARYRQQF
ncbi:MAG: hypothetical protein EA415_04770 [Sphaerobacteraceae bacterium]|nr:MAG: hypothetical protein EA415_04770 [Sphaerobacteraceae bacterium]